MDILKNMRIEYKLLSILWISLIFISIINFFTYSINTEFDLNHSGSPIYVSILFFYQTGAIILFLTLLVFLDSKLNKTKKPKKHKKIIFNKKRDFIFFFFIIFISLPWFFAISGIYISDIPILGELFLAKQTFNGLPIAHLGLHHGFIGLFLIFISYFALKIIVEIKERRIGDIINLVFIFFFLCGLYMVIDDFTNEQFFKRFGMSKILPMFTYTSKIVPIFIGISFIIDFYKRRTYSKFFYSFVTIILIFLFVIAH